MPEGFDPSTSTQPEFSITVRVYIEDTDAGGIVYYVNYLKFMERSRTEFLRSFGYDKPAVLDDGLLLVVHSAEVNYRRAARLDDKLTITTSIASLARTSVRFKQNVWRGNELLCQGLIRVACVTGDTLKPRPIPADIHSKLSTLTES
ncbi:tol-pal system-associated acyl-CoA thioesterase [Marinimicrobium sp. ABcell2]|uniref:tol-pal system-associated acyl-CoA thioesterase n=1 Tax=Marinimicrobium sp. ABcell2 TaxID=3069751 RepID=UPI0027B43E12|nr:tol-pal system-associated acyl-CoA thioesterase [Marinimicrobium sp. ABcell2]MDQ2077902.1 tol-pal system-associated acyl-CoA thioesterase [Marinimicrobium sp. ABcell2]